MKCYHTGQLADRKLDPEPPFLLDISEHAGDGEWLCVSVLRRLPGKRLVLHLQRDSQQVLCKLFYLERDYRRELRGNRHLLQGKINTPQLLQHYRQANSNCRVILYQYVPGTTLEDLVLDAGITAHSPALLQTVAAVASMHRAGLRQIDIHLGNFLYLEDAIYVVDTAAVRQHRAPLASRLALENLGDLLAQFRPGQIDDLEPIWQQYCRAQPKPNWQLQQLPAAIDKMRRLRWRHYRRKLTRDCSEFICQHSFRRLAIWRRDLDSNALQHAMNDADTAMTEGGFLKQGNTATVACAAIDQLEVVIKRYNIKNWRHRLNRSWRPSRGWHSWQNAHYLLFSGLNTPLPIALIEERCGPLRGRAFFFSAYVEGQDLKTALLDADNGRRAELLGEFAGIVRGYYRAGISHGDMKADNFIVTASGVTIIDLDPMTHHRRHTSLVRALQRDLRRFLDNFKGAVGDDINKQLLTQLPEALRP